MIYQALIIVILNGKLIPREAGTRECGFLEVSSILGVITSEYLHKVRTIIIVLKMELDRIGRLDT